MSIKVTYFKAFLLIESNVQSHMAAALNHFLGEEGYTVREDGLSWDKRNIRMMVECKHDHGKSEGYIEYLEVPLGPIQEPGPSKMDQTPKVEEKVPVKASEWVLEVDSANSLEELNQVVERLPIEVAIPATVKKLTTAKNVVIKALNKQGR